MVITTYTKPRLVLNTLAKVTVGVITYQEKK